MWAGPEEPGAAAGRWAQRGRSACRGHRPAVRAAVRVPSLARAPARPPFPSTRSAPGPANALPPPPSGRSSGWPRRRGPHLLSLAALPAGGGRGAGGGHGDHPGSTPTSSLVPSFPH